MIDVKAKAMTGSFGWRTTARRSIRTGVGKSRMSVISSVISAVAASLAAVLAGLTLYVTGRREDRKWLREVLIDAYVEYLDASFGCRGAYARISRVDGYDPNVFAEMHAETEAAYNRQGVVLTKLRLMAPKRVVQAAEGLHRADYAVMIATFGRQQPPTDDDVWSAARDDQHRTRERFLETTRRSLGLGESSAVTRGFEFPGP